MELIAENQGDEILDETKYYLDLEKLCVHCNLGELKSDPVSISGGLLHRMYAIVTTEGNYAVKILNSSIMSRQTALGNYRNSEQVARLASTKTSAIPAEVINGEAVQNIEGQYFLVFNWVYGAPLKLETIETYHCSVMGGDSCNNPQDRFLGAGNDRGESGNETRNRLEFLLSKRGGKIFALEK